MLLSLLVIITLTFVLMKTLPGDPFNEEQALPPSIHQALRKHYGLEDPWTIQFGRYLKGISQWNLGPSFRYKERSVNQIINESFPVSAVLGLQALAIAVPFGVLLGTWAALAHGTWKDHLILGIIALSISIPNFVLGSSLQYIFGLKLQWLPLARWGSWEQSLLPCLALAALPCAFIARLIRANLLEVLRQDYIRTARAKGLSETRIITVHALKNAFLPILGYLGPLIVNVMVGSFVVEKIFAIPGLGQWFVNSVLNRDYTVIMGITVFYSVLLLSVTFLADTLFVILDPRATLPIKE